MPWEALLLSIPMATSAVLKQFGNYMMPETSSTAFGIVVAGLVIVVAARGHTLRRDILLSVAVLLAVLSRPAFLFLPFLCALAILIMAPVFHRTTKFSSNLRLSLRALSWTGIPLLGYSTFRLLVVSHFGIVNFGGVALAGLGTNPIILDQPTAGRLPSAEMRRLAQAILNKRAEVARTNPARRLSYVYDADSIARRPMLEAWQHSFDPSIYDVAIPAARAFYGASEIEILNPDWRLINQKLGRLSAATLTLHRQEYVRWVWSVGTNAFEEVFHYETGGRLLIGIAFAVLLLGIIALPGVRSIAEQDLPIYAVTLSATVACLALLDGSALANLSKSVVGVVKGTILGSLYPLGVSFYCLMSVLALLFSRKMGERSQGDRSLGWAYALCAFALLFFGSGVLLVSLVEMPLMRYVVAVSPILPGAILLVTAKWVQIVYRNAARAQTVSTRGVASSEARSIARPSL
jgi:hypothetical protein